MQDAGIVHQAVEPPVIGKDILEQALYPIDCRQVQGSAARAWSAASQGGAFIGHQFQSIRVACRQCQGGALGRTFQCHGAPDTAGGARNHDHVACEAHVSLSDCTWR